MRSSSSGPSPPSSVGSPPVASSSSGVGWLVRLLHLRHQVAELLLHVPGLLRQLGGVDLDARDGREGVEHGQRRLRERELGEDVRHLPQQARPPQARLGGRAEQHAVEPADVAVVDDLQLQLPQLGERLLVGGGAEDACVVTRGASGWPSPRR